VKRQLIVAFMESYPKDADFYAAKKKVMKDGDEFNERFMRKTKVVLRNANQDYRKKL
jgi:hypothetical protein